MKRKDVYETPVAKIVTVSAEGVLCTSLNDTTVENYTYEEFKW
jgi:hypothetical protein